MKLFIIILGVTLTACSSTHSSKPLPNPPSSQDSVKSDEQSDELTESQRIYYFQHKLLPEWTFDSVSGDLLFADLILGELVKLQNIAAEIISPDYAKGITSAYYPEHNAVLLTFPTPKYFTHCLFILIKKGDKAYSFYTYEKTLSVEKNDPFKGVVGLWSEDGAHGNLGGRTYSTANEFVRDLMNK